MNRTDIDALIQEALDGEATPQRLERLRVLLAADPAARARHRELEAVLGVLGSGPLVDPPGDLRARVLAALPARPSARTSRDRSPAWAGLLGGRPRFAIPLVAAVAGVALVAAYLTWPVARLGDPDGVRGAMTPTVASRPFTDELRAGAVTARLTVSRQGPGVDLRVEAGGGPGEVAILFDTRALRPLDPGPFALAEPGRLILAVGGRSLDAAAAFQILGPVGGPLEVVLTTASGTQRTVVALDRLGAARP